MVGQSALIFALVCGLLAVAYGLVRNADGQIDIDSAPGRGTTLHIALPAPHERALHAVATTHAYGVVEGRMH